MQYTTLALAALLGAAAVVSADQQRQVSAGYLRRLPASAVGKNHPTSQLSRVLQDPEDDHAHEDEDHHDDDEDDEHHEDEDEHEDEDHAEGKEMEKLPKWMTEEHHDDEHGEEHGHDEDEDEDHDDLETAVAVEGDEDDEHHDDEHEEGKSKCPRFIACIVGTWPRRHKYHI